MMGLALLVALLAFAPRDTVPPLVALPQPGLDDSAAYQGYMTRLFRDGAGNALQVYVNRGLGRVVHVWADAADESVGFSVRDSSGAPASLAWASIGAEVSRAASPRSLSYALAAGPPPLGIGLWLLGSMRVERDFQYQGRDALPLDSAAFLVPELVRLVAHLQRLDPAERRRALALVGAARTAELSTRLEPTITLRVADTVWTVHVDQTSFDGKNHLSLVLGGDARETVAALAGRTVKITARPGQRTRPARLTVTVITDAPALTPLGRDEIFNDDFRRFYDAVRADTAHPLRFRRLEREVRGMELLCYREKLMAGLPNFATYFGRDMLMAALLMQPVWAAAMPEHVIGSALGKLSSEGDVSHEEALGGEAIRENAARYNRLVDDYRYRAAAGDRAGASRVLARARRILGALQAVRENYIMVDDDFQLPLVAAHYLTDPRLASERKRRFLRDDHRLSRLLANLAFVARQAEPYARAPAARHLVSFPRASDSGWLSASWRDSRAGYGGGRYAMDVNVIWVPRALEAIGTIVDALPAIGVARSELEAVARALGPGGQPFIAYLRDPARLRRAIARWRGAERHFWVALAPGAVTAAVTARLGSHPEPERAFWADALGVAGAPSDTLRFLALSLDADGRPIPIVNTDPAMWLLVEPLAPARVHAFVAPILIPYPVGLFVDALGPLVANDAYAPPAVWDAFRRDPYHSPSVVWGRDVNLLLAGLAMQIAAAPPGADVGPLEDALQRTVTAVDRSGVRHAELWSYRIADGKLLPMRYGTSSDVQLWSLTDLCVQYLLASLPQH